jgi:hypothetical protein
MLAPALCLAVLCVAARAAETPAAVAASDLSAVKKALASVPGDALGFVLVKNLTEADAKIQKLAAIVGAPAISLLGKVKEESGIKKGLDEKGTVVVMIVPGPREGQPTVVMALPITDYKEFAEQLELASSDGSIAEFKPPQGPQMLAARRGGYALIGGTVDRSVLEKMLSARQSIAADAAGIEPWLAENDAAFVGTRAGIVLAAAQGRKALAKMDEQFGKIDKDFGGPGGANLGSGDPMAGMRMILHFYGKLLDAADKELALAAVAVSVDAQGAVRVKGRLRLQSGSQFGQSLGEIQPQRQDLLAGLPGGPFFVAFGAAMPKSLMRQLTDVGLDFMKTNASIYGLSPEQAVQLGKVSMMQDIEHAHSLALVMKSGKRGEPVYSNMFACLRIDNAPRYLEQYQTQLQAVNEVLKGAADSLMKPTEVKRLEIGGHPALELQVTIPLPKIPEGNPTKPMQEAMLRLIFGPTNKVTVYVAAANETTAVLGYGTTPERVREMIELVRSGKAGLAGDADLAATAALLPAGAQWVAYVSPRAYVGLVQRMLREMAAGMGAAGMGAGGGLPFALPPFPQTPPVGMAIRASAGTLDGTLAVPSAVLKAAGEYVLTVQQSIMNPNPQIP